MKIPDVILVPTDFGPPSAAALDYAVELAKRFGSREVVLMHAYQIPIVSFPDGAIVATAEMTTNITDAASKELDKLATDAASDEVPVRPLLREGEAADAVAKAVEELGAELVVMGTRGRHGIAHILLGSVTEKVVRTSKVPVLTVHGEEPSTPSARARAASEARQHH